eukprot:NODE_2629_length_1022_cov_71.331844_g2610_i0.p1 GENE.NODE_2629_length_1022_cov_71.331844_g2610_i0~~NODE_2629_length_1022_cov_71.331844_g2610_i0.p1  ORF type:complete len:286 (+),score=27.98 NODE_2629_length_1022_cov_71.331844_g2610_i0:86-943(+)
MASSRPGSAQLPDRPASTPPRPPSGGPRPGLLASANTAADDNFVGRKLSVASMAVEQNRSNDLYKSQAQSVVDFLGETNQDFEKILHSGLVEKDVTRRFADGARGILTTMRTSGGVSPDASLSTSKEAFKEVLSQSLQSSVLNKDRTNAFQPTAQRAVRRKPRSIDPMPDRVKRKMRTKLIANPDVAAAAATALGASLQSAALSKPQPAGPKKKDLLVVTGAVNYASLLQEQSDLREETEEKDRRYISMMHSFDELQRTVERRFSQILKQDDTVLLSPAAVGAQG